MASDLTLGSIDLNSSSFDPIPSSISNSTPSVDSRAASAASFLTRSRDLSPIAVPPLTPPRVSLLRRASSSLLPTSITNILFKSPTTPNLPEPKQNENELNEIDESMFEPKSQEPIYDLPNNISAEITAKQEPVYEICYAAIGGFIRPTPQAPSHYFNTEAPTTVPPLHTPPKPPVPDRPSLEETFGFSTEEPLYEKTEPVYFNLEPATTPPLYAPAVPPRPSLEETFEFSTEEPLYAIPIADVFSFSTQNSK